MFIAQFIVTPNWKQPKGSLSGRKGTYIVVFSMKCYVSVNRENCCCLQQHSLKYNVEQKSSDTKEFKTGKTNLV